MNTQPSLPSIRRRKHLSNTLVATLLSCSFLSAQRSTEHAQEPNALSTTSIMGQSVGLAEFGDQLRGGGPDYEFSVELTSDGQSTASFTPALGTVAPRAMPVRFTLQGVRRGERSVRLQGGRPRLHIDAEDTTAVIHHGTACVERYVLRTDGVKQSYVFAEAPPGQGELSVVLGIDTNLTSVRRGDVSNGFTLSSEYGGVHIGAVVGIDAAGQRAAGKMHFDGSSLTLSLPNWFVEDAVYPLELDPLLGSSIGFSMGSLDDGATDVAYDDGSDCYLVVWQRALSATRVAIRGQRISASGTIVGGLITVRSTSVSTAPSVGNVKRSGEFLICYEHGPSLFGPFEIQGNTVDAGSGNVSSSVVIATSTTSDTRPDVSSNATGQSDNTIVVWERGTSLEARLVACSAGSPPAPGTTATLGNGGLANPRPAISKNGGSNGRHVVVYEDRSGMSRVIRARALDFNLNLLGSSVIIGEPNQFGEHPDADGDGTEFMAVWHENEPGSNFRTDVRCRILRWNGSALTFVTPISNVAVVPDSDEGFAAVAYCAGKYLVAAEAPGSAPLGIITRTQMFDRSAQLCDGVISSGNLLDQVVRPTVCSRLSGGEASDEGLVVFTTRSATPPFAGDLRAIRFESYRGQAPISVGAGCGPGGVASVSGPFSMGNPDFKFTVSGADPATQVFGFLLNLAGPPLPQCGSCTFTDPIAIFFVAPSAAGEAEFPFPLPCDRSFTGTNMEFQWVAIGGHTARPCPMARRVAASDRVRLTFDL